VLRYRIGTSGQSIRLSDRVVAHFDQYRQRRWSDQEAGGQLFARLDLSEIVIEVATGPRPTDRRSRTSYRGDREAEQREIEQHHSEGLHYVGDWHTHPTPEPSPSLRDLSTINEIFCKSHHQLNGFILIVVGTKSFPIGISLSLHNEKEHLILDADGTN
jgi:integrative and conjugative element protein (TIGR02256 family)